MNLKDIPKGKLPKIFFGILTVAVLGVLWSSLSSSKDTSIDNQSIYVTAKIDRGNIAQFVTAAGTIRPVSVVIVGTQLSGTVSKLYVDYNDEVKKGQILLELDPAIYISQVKQAKANLQVAKAAMDLASSNRKRSENLFFKNFIQASTFEHDKQEEISSSAQYELALAQLEKAETDLRNTYIRSPIDGLVLKKDVDLGQTVAATFQTPELFRIAQNFSHMEIDTNISEADISSVKIGMKANFTVDAFEQRIFEGLVKQIRLSPNTANGPVNYNVVLDVANTDLSLLPGMTANVQIVTSLKSNVLRIPTAALYFSPTDDSNVIAKTDHDLNTTQTISGDGSLVGQKKDLQNYRIFKIGSDDKILPIAVNVGTKNRQFTEMTGGDLHQGDSVVIQEHANATNK